MQEKRPIGIFDSGIGGLTVAKAINRLLPNESIIYYGDTKHLPYGDKSVSTIKRYAKGISSFLVKQNCKCIIIACNSASTAAFSDIHSLFSNTIPIYNVVDPLVEKIIELDYNNVGLIATKATVASNVYKTKLQSKKRNINVASLATPLLVPMIEEGFYKNEISSSVINEYLKYEPFNTIETLLLACTHYPLIKNEVEGYFKGKVDVHDSTDVVAQWVQKELNKRNLLSEQNLAQHKFYFSDITPAFKVAAKMFFEKPISVTLHDIWV